MGKLVVVAGPIGNLSDRTLRAEAALKEADFWIVEDTRVSGKLQAALGIRKPMRVLNEHTQGPRIQEYVQVIASGSQAVLLTDAGTPGISDPGTQLIDQCYTAQIEVDAAPGASAVTCALMMSGFFAQRFVFLGFLGRKPSAMRKEIEPYVDSPLTIVLFESPNRIDKLLETCTEVLGERRYVIGRELTKLHQQIYRNVLPQIPVEKDVPRKGEFTVVIEGFRRHRAD